MKPTTRPGFMWKTTNWTKAVLLAGLLGLSGGVCANAPARPLYCYHFDTTNAVAGLDWRFVNAGTGRLPLVHRCKDASVWVDAFGAGALDSANAFWSKTATSLWLQGDADGLGCSTDTGFTISFWMCAPENTTAWSDFFGFRLGGVDVRFEYTDKEKTFTCYAEKAGQVLNALAAYTPLKWTHLCVVWNFEQNACDLYVDGAKVGRILVSRRNGLLEELHIGGWVRANGEDRSYHTGNTGIDEVAVYGFSIGADDLAALQRKRPGAIPRGRQLLHAYNFDTVTSSGVSFANAGTDVTRGFCKELKNKANSCSPGALDSAHGFLLSDEASFWVQGDSDEGLGCSTNTGFTLSFWVKAPQTPVAWSDMLSLRIGEQNIRFEWDGTDRAFSWYGSSEFWRNARAKRTLPADVWTHICLVWNHAANDGDVYVAGTKIGALNLWPPLNERVDLLCMGRTVKNESGGDRWGFLAHAPFDELALFNYSFSPDQVAALAQNAPALLELAETNLVRTVSGSCAWDGFAAGWTVAGTARQMVWPAGEDTNVEAVVTVAAPATLALDSFVAARRVAFVNGSGDASVDLALVAADGGPFEPQTLAVGAGVALTLPCHVSTTGIVELAANARIVIDASDYDGRAAALRTGGFVLPDGETDVLAHVSVRDDAYVPSISEDGRSILLAPVDGTPLTAYWTGAAGDGDWNNAANWDCRDAADAPLADARPDARTTVVVTGAAALDVPKGAAFAYKAFTVAGAVTLTADCDWRGVEEVRILDGATLDVAGHAVRMSACSGGTLGTATVTDGTGGGALHLDVAAGETQVNDSIRLTGALKLVKDGAGTLLAAVEGQSYSGGTVVAAGTLAFGRDGGDWPVGSTGAVVRVETGATLDMNGTGRHLNTTFVLAGGTLYNGKGIPLPEKVAQLGTVRLEADSAFVVDADYGFVHPSVGATTLDLAGHALTVTMPYGRNFYLFNTDVSAGTLDVVKGGYVHFGTNGVRAANVSLRLNAAAVTTVPVEVRDLRIDYAQSAYDKGQGTFAVRGVFAPEGASHPNVALQNGATIDLSSRSGAWSARCVHAYTGTTNFLTAAAGAQVTVDLSGRADLRELSKAADPHVVTWDGAEIPASAVFAVDDATAQNRFYVRRDATGLRLCYSSGTVLLVR